MIILSGMIARRSFMVSVPKSLNGDAGAGLRRMCMRSFAACAGISADEVTGIVTSYGENSTVSLCLLSFSAFVDLKNRGVSPVSHFFESCPEFSRVALCRLCASSVERELDAQLRDAPRAAGKRHSTWWSSAASAFQSTASSRYGGRACACTK